MYDAARHVLEASIASRLWNLAIMKPTRSKYISLLYDLNPNILVLFVLHECLQHTAVQRQITQKNITFWPLPSCPWLLPIQKAVTTYLLGVHTSSRCEPQTRFSGSLQNYKLVVLAGFTRTSSPHLPLSAYFQPF